MPHDLNNAVRKTNSFEDWRQKHNIAVTETGSISELSSLISENKNTFSTLSVGQRFVYASGVDIPIEHDNLIDNNGGYVIFEGGYTLNTNITSDTTIFQGTNISSATWQAIITTVGNDKILVRSSSGVFDASAAIKTDTTPQYTISASNIGSLVVESYKKLVGRVTKGTTTLSQDISRNGFHVPNYVGYIQLNGSPTIPNSFVEGASIYQGTIGSESWQGTILFVEGTDRVHIKSVSRGTAPSATAILKVGNGDSTNRIIAARVTSWNGVTTDNQHTNIIELNRPISSASDTITINYTSIVSAINELQSDIGNISTLTTTARTSLVNATNELNAKVGSTNIDNIASADNTLTTALNQLHTELGDITGIDSSITNDTNLVDTINEVITNLGGLSSLGTTIKTSFVNSINELETAIRGSKTNYTLDTSSNDLVGAINEHDGELGTITASAMGTTATTVSGAINEHEGQINTNATNIATLTTNLGTANTNITTLTTNLGTANTSITALNSRVEPTQSFDSAFDSSTIMDALNELMTEKANLTSSSSQTVNSDITFSTGNTLTIPTGATLDVSSGSLLIGSGGSDLSFNTAFVNLEAGSTTQGISIDRSEITGSVVSTLDAKIQWNDTQATGNKGHRGWQITGLTSGASPVTNTSDIVTFYNAKDLVSNNTENNVTVTWDATNQNFDFDLTDTGATAGTYGTVSSIPAITVDAKGRITSISTNDITTALTVDGDSGTQDCDLADDDLQILGTTNEISTAVTKTGTNVKVTLSLPDNVTIGNNLTTTNNLSVGGNTTLGNSSSDDTTVSGDLTISGDLTVNGTTTTINTETLSVDDNIIVLNDNVTGTPSENAGIEIERGSSTNVLVRWNETTDRWQFTNNGTNYHNMPLSTEYDNYSSWTLQDGDTTTYTVTSGDTLQIASGTGITSNFTADDVLTITNTKPFDKLVFVDGDGTSQNKTNNDTLSFSEGSGSGATIDIDFNASNALEFSVTNTDKGSSQNIFKNVAADTGTAVADTNNDTLTLSGGNKITTSVTADSISIAHDNTSTLSGNYGGSDNGTVIERVTVDDAGHVTAVVTRSLDSRFDNYSSWTAEDDDGTQYTIESGNTLKFSEGTGIDVNFTADRTLSIGLKGSGVSAGTYGTNSTEDGKYIKGITVNAEGQITAISSDNFDDRYINVGQANSISRSMLQNDSVSTQQIADGSINNSHFSNGTLTFSKMQNISTSRILGRTTANNGSIEELSAASVRTLLNVANGANNYILPSDNITNASVSSNTLTLTKQGGTSVTFTPNDTTYSAATSSILGLVKIGYTQSGKNYPVELNSASQMFVNVPWTDTTYTAGNGLTLSSNSFAINANQSGIINQFGDSTTNNIVSTSAEVRVRFGGSNEFLMSSGGDFHADGNIIAHSTTTNSDKNLKKNIKKVDNALSIIEQIEGVTFDWKDTAKGSSAGVIAQDVEKVLPSAVKTVKDINNNDSTTKVVDYNQLFAICIEAIKELQKEIKALKHDKNL